MCVGGLLAANTVKCVWDSGWRLVLLLLDDQDPACSWLPAVVTGSTTVSRVLTGAAITLLAIDRLLFTIISSS